MRALPSIVLPLLLLGACGSAPRPPSVGESGKRPANMPLAIELQLCQHELHNSQIRSKEMAWMAESAAVTRERMAALQQNIAALQSAVRAVEHPDPVNTRNTPAAEPGNRLYVLRFAFASSRLEVPAAMAAALAMEARSAALIMIRGRTDGSTETAAEGRVARERAIAARDYLVAAGAAPSRIRVTHQAVGDHEADNASTSGRDLNRRVEIEIYRSLPSRQDGPAARSAPAELPEPRHGQDLGPKTKSNDSLAK